MKTTWEIRVIETNSLENKLMQKGYWPTVSINSFINYYNSTNLFCAGSWSCAPGFVFKWYFDVWWSLQAIFWCRYSGQWLINNCFMIGHWTCMRWQIATEVHWVKLVITISYPTSLSGIIVFKYWNCCFCCTITGISQLMFCI